MTFVYIIIIAFVIVFVFTIIQQVSKNKQGKNLSHYVKNKSDLNADYTLLNSNHDKILCLDKSGKLILCESLNNGEIKDKVINFEDILEVEIKTNNNTVSKISIGGTIAGGVLAGGVGALIGSQNNKKSIEKIKTISLKINTKDFDSPVITFLIFESIDNKGANHDSYLVQEALENAEKWEGMLKIILEKNKMSS